MRLIDADKLGDEIVLREWNVRNNKNLYAHVESILWALNVAWREIQVTPTIEAEPVIHSKWVRDGDFLICINCESEINIKNSLGVENKRNYCPNCGAKMDGDKNDGSLQK